MEEFSYVLAKNFVAFVPVCLYFFTAAHFHLAYRSLLTTTVSHFLTSGMKFSCLSSNETDLRCFQSLALALSLLLT